ncbi:hypothetical protein [Sphingomonas sp.]|uniref:hypothetical protein n=1 Tax=Sphingomonas sp. TaxID=28214 RepID=UPI002E3413AB|nr:hypothetical protein [Sphingomonas sp.]HEX4692992.1 hypothetical protein [Sphingomonas sp.]
MQGGLQVVVGVYVERLAQKFPDVASMNQAARGFAAAFGSHMDELPSFGKPCAQRAGIVMDRAKNALSSIAPPKK